MSDEGIPNEPHGVLKDRRETLVKKAREEGSIIERIGSFQVPVRSDKTANRREKKIQEKVSQRIYHRRYRIAKNMVQASDMNPSMSLRDAAATASIKSGVSPISAPYWSDYITYLSDYEDGKDSFLNKLSDELDFVKSMRRYAMVYLIYAGIISLFLVLMVSGASPDSGFPSYVSAVLSFVIPVSVFSWVYYVVLEAAVEMRKFTGPRKKKVSDFMPYVEIIKWSK